jgi:hypothetical protein
MVSERLAQKFWLEQGRFSRVNQPRFQMPRVKERAGDKDGVNGQSKV